MNGEIVILDLWHSGYKIVTTLHVMLLIWDTNTAPSLEKYTDVINLIIRQFLREHIEWTLGL